MCALICVLVFSCQYHRIMYYFDYFCTRSIYFVVCYCNHSSYKSFRIFYLSTWRWVRQRQCLPSGLLLDYFKGTFLLGKGERASFHLLANVHGSEVFSRELLPWQIVKTSFNFQQGLSLLIVLKGAFCLAKARFSFRIERKEWKLRNIDFTICILGKKN